MFRLKNAKDQRVFETFNARGTRFESRLKVNHHLELSEPPIHWLNFCYWGALGPFPATHIY